MSFLPCRWSGEVLAEYLGSGRIDVWDDEVYAQNPAGQWGILAGEWSLTGNADIDPLYGVIKGGSISFSAAFLYPGSTVPAHEGSHGLYHATSLNSSQNRYDDDRIGEPVNAYDVEATCQG